MMHEHLLHTCCTLRCKWGISGKLRAREECKTARTRALYALCLRGLNCLSWPCVSSVALHVVETTFCCGFDSFRAHQTQYSCWFPRSQSRIGHKLGNKSSEHISRNQIIPLRQFGSDPLIVG